MSFTINPPHFYPKRMDLVRTKSMTKMIISILTFILTFMWGGVRASFLSEAAFTCSRPRCESHFSCKDIVTPRQKRTFIPKDGCIDSENLMIWRNLSSKLKPQGYLTKMYGISEWRDTMFDLDLQNGRPELREGIAHLTEKNGQLPREVTILPFPCDEVLLQGETKELHLYEERFLNLFEKCINEHSGVFAVGLISDSGIIQTVPLCEIEAYNRMELGIFLTARVVARATIVDITSEEPYISGVCVEITDTVPSNLDLPNMIAGNVENTLVQISSLEKRLKKDVESVENINSKINRKRLRYKLDALFDNDKELPTTKNDSYEDVYDESMDFFDSSDKFKLAYQNALEHDTQGYQFNISTADKGGDQRSTQSLMALSWAAFCVDNIRVEFRIQALACDDLFDRLKLASYTLRERKEELESNLKLNKRADADSKMDEDDGA